MPRPIIAIINIKALKSNLIRVKKIMPKSKIWAVVKANGYGHGLENVVKGFESADGLSLIEFDKAVFLRELGWDRPIMMMEGMFDYSDLDIIDKHNLQPVIHNEEQIKMIHKKKFNNRIEIYLKINTGMNRLGFPCNEVKKKYHELISLPSIKKVSLLTHFANAETNNSLLNVEKQVEFFQKSCEGIKAEITLSNSAALLHKCNIYSDWVRPGIMLYGGSPGGGSASSFGLTPVMTLKSKFISIQNLNPGDTVGYGSLFKAQSKMRIGIVACGYGDGYPRHAKTGTPVIVNNIRTKILGQVSMDLITIDITKIPDVNLNSEVILWGEKLSIDEIASLSGTVSYELMCSVNERVIRVKSN